MRLTIAVTLAYLGPPVIGLIFLVYIAKAMSTADVLRLMSGTVLPFFIVGSTIAAVAFFRWFLRPVALLEDGQCDSDKALQRMRSFLWVYWLIFLARHFIGVAVVIFASQSLLLLEEADGVWLRMLGLAVMLSSLFGLPAFLYVIDFFATTFKKHTLREPLLRVRTRVFLIAVLLPVLLNTAVLQYLMPRIGGLNAELVGLWLVLLAIAVVAAYNLMGSLDRSMTGLRRVSALRNEGQIALRPDDLQLRSMDEFGVLTCEYRELLTNLQQQATLLDLRNQVLVTSNQESDSDVLLLKLLGIVSTHLESKCSALVSITAKGDIEILASMGNGSMPSSFDAHPNLLKAVRASSMTILPTAEASWWPGDTGEFVVLPLRESSETTGYQAVFATLDGELKNNVESNQLRLLAQFGPEIAAAVRAAQVAKEKSTLENMLLDAQRMEVVGRLAAGVAHDFNNILMVVSGAAGLIKLEADDEGLSGFTENTDLIMEASKKGADLTRQLLTFARPSEGKVAVLNMNEVVGSLDAFLRRLLPGEIQFEIELTDTANVKANKGQIEQVITNLVINARDAMEGVGKLRLETSQTGNWFELRVIDNGTGMSPEVVAHIFEPFYSTKPTSKGTGLGLATAYGIVKNSGGSIQVESIVGKGTSMIVRLPTTSEGPLKKLHSSKPKQQSRNGSILLAEDNDNIRGIIVDLLAAKGFSVIAVANGTDAIGKIEDDSVPIDLLLTDIIMPGIKGTEVANRMAGQRPEAGILLMTGYADPEMLEQAIAAGRTIIQKPFAPEQLLVQIDTLLG